MMQRVSKSEASRVHNVHAAIALSRTFAKTWSSEYGLTANDLAIQVHGGYGNTRDFGVEQLFRENRLEAIQDSATAAHVAAFRESAEMAAGYRLTFLTISL